MTNLAFCFGGALSVSALYEINTTSMSSELLKTYGRPFALLDSVLCERA